MYYVRSPAELLDGLKDAACKEYGSFVIVFEELAVVVEESLLATEIILIVNEIHLYPGGRDGSDLDDERPVHITDDYVHP